MDNIQELWEGMSAEQRQQFTEMLVKMNVDNRNKEKVKTFAEKILNHANKKKSKYIRFLESDSVNALIYAPTQVGKTSATREFIEACFKAGVPVVVSTDNKTDQQEQLFARIEKELSGADVMLLKVSDKSFGEDMKGCVKNGKHRFVAFCLDNAVQIEKFIVTLASLTTRYPTEMKKYKKFAIIHDEADQITKDRETNVIMEDQAESHKKWLELMNLINQTMGYLDLKRIFVTATPENSVLLYNIECPDVVTLEIPGTYTGYKDLDYIALEDDLDIKEVIQGEVARIKAARTCEAILYCIERKIADGHNKVLLGLSSYLKCTVNTYNGNGITAHMRTVNVSKRFEAMLKRAKIDYKRKDKVFTMKNLTIRKFYTMCKKLGENCVVTIGKDLIARGISYVSEDKKDPLTATTIIYKPGMSMHAVGICQTIGRITGCAMPSLKRRVYAPKDVIDTYRSYNKNQEEYIKRISKESKLTKEVIEEMEFEKLKRKIDRAKLGLKMNVKSEVAEGDAERMKQLINMWWNADTIIGKILRFVYESEVGVSEGELRNYIESIGSNNVTAHYQELVKFDERRHDLVFERTSNKITKLRKEAAKYIDSL